MSDEHRDDKEYAPNPKERFGQQLAAVSRELSGCGSQPASSQGEAAADNRPEDLRRWTI